MTGGICSLADFTTMKFAAQATMTTSTPASARRRSRGVDGGRPTPEARPDDGSPALAGGLDAETPAGAPAGVMPVRESTEVDLTSSSSSRASSSSSSVSLSHTKRPARTMSGITRIAPRVMPRATATVLSAAWFEPPVGQPGSAWVGAPKRRCLGDQIGDVVGVNSMSSCFRPPCPGGVTRMMYGHRPRRRRCRAGAAVKIPPDDAQLLLVVLGPDPRSCRGAPSPRP